MLDVKFVTPILFSLALFACNSSPKVIEPESSGSQDNAPIFKDAPVGAVNPDAGAAGGQDMNAAEHKVTVVETLNTERYTYLRVKENQEEYWIAITKREVKIGSTCYFRDGLLKKNFQSKEFNRIFETLYLVGEFRDESAEANVQGGIPPATEALAAPKSVQRAPGAVKISDLLANASKYAGKTITVTGKCVKINPMIMGRNWLHLQDGSTKNKDLTVTTTEVVQLGAVVTLEGTVTVNKDFGAGYKYDCILEGAVLK